MIIYPEAQKKAQAEIDTVVGKDRLPDSNDKESLPYVEALMKEVLRYFFNRVIVMGYETDVIFSRWRPAGPLGWYNLLLISISGADFA